MDVGDRSIPPDKGGSNTTRDAGKRAAKVVDTTNSMPGRGETADIATAADSQKGRENAQLTAAQASMPTGTKPADSDRGKAYITKVLTSIKKVRQRKGASLLWNTQRNRSMIKLHFYLPVTVSEGLANQAILRMVPKESLIHYGKAIPNSTSRKMLVVMKDMASAQRLVEHPVPVSTTQQRQGKKEYLHFLMDTAPEGHIRRAIDFHNPKFSGIEEHHVLHAVQESLKFYLNDWH